MKYYWETLKKAIDFKSRSTRKEFWLFYLTNLVFIYGMQILITWLSLGKWAEMLIAYFYLFITIPWLSVTVRRLHDTSHSGWWVLVPFANFILLFFDSTPGTNKYGPNPKGIETAANVPVKSTKSKVLTGLLIAGAVLAPIALLFISVFSITKPLVTTTNNYLDAIKKGEIERSYQDFTSIEFRNQIPLEEYKTLVSKETFLQHKEKVFFNSRSISGSTGRLSGTITTDYGSVVPVEVRLVKEGGVWKITGFHLFK